MNSIKFEIGGKEREFILGLGLIGDLLKYHETDFEGLSQLYTTNNIFALGPPTVFYAHKHAVRKAKGVVDFDIYDVEEWIEEIDKGVLNDNIQQLMVLFYETLSNHLGKIMADADKGPKKK